MDKEVGLMWIKKNYNMIEELSVSTIPSDRLIEHLSLLGQELERLNHNNQILANALLKSCYYDDRLMSSILNSQGNLK